MDREREKGRQTLIKQQILMVEDHHHLRWEGKQHIKGVLINGGQCVKSAIFYVYSDEE